MSVIRLRGFLGVPLALVVLAAACVQTAPAVSQPSPAVSQPSPAVSQPSPATPAAQTPKPGPKTLTLGEWQEVSILNTLMTSESGNVVSGTKLTLRGLLFTDQNGEFEGELAQEVPSLRNGGISADGKTITYKLRSGVTWHDGKPVTSADVKFTWQAIMNPAHKVATTYGYNGIEAVDTPNPLTVVVRFREPFAPWAILFDVIMPMHILENAPDFNGSRFHHQPVGFGPFKVVENVKGNRIVYEAFDGYWRGRPKIDRIFVRFFGSTDAMIQALKAKELDLAWLIPLSSIPELKGLVAQGITTMVVPATAAERYVFNMDHAQVPLFADKQLRKALSLAVDRKTIVDKLLFGLTTIARGDWDNTPWENTRLKPVETNVAEARRILDSIGWRPGPDGIRVKDGKRLSFTHTTTAGSQLRENVQLLVQQNFKDVGAEMIIKNRPTGQLFGTYSAGGGWARGDYEMGGWSHGVTIPDADISSRYLCKEIASERNPAGAQWYRYCNPQIDALLAQQTRELDPEKRKDLFFKVQELLLEEYQSIWLYDTSASWGVLTRVKNFDRTLNAKFGGFHWRAEEWDIQ